MNILSELTPQAVWNFFENICSIPHPPKHEIALRNYIIEVAKEHGCSYETDDYGNLLVKKSAFVGFEDNKIVILQSHLDMVPQKDVDLEFDFETDKLKLEIENNEFVTARGTTLGADNGVGVAAMLAIISDNKLKHGKLKFLFTVEEEIGLNGASNLASEFLEGDILINLDSEDEGEIFIGCAGGVRTDVEIPIDVQEVEIFDNDGIEITQKFQLVVEGLHGGHSGCDIHLNLGNGLKIISEIIWELINKFSGVKLRYLAGGTADNAIVRRAEAYLFCYRSEFDEIMEFIKLQNQKYRQLLGDLDKNIQINLTKIAPRNDNKFASAYSDLFQEKLLTTLLNCPNGVINYHPYVSGIVETSTNLAVVTADCLDKEPVNGENYKIKVTTSQRSSDDFALISLAKRLKIHFEQIKDSLVTHRSHYVGWNPNAHSQILETAKQSLKKTLNSQAKVMVIHAGLECGAFSENNPKLDMISIGPDIISAHSPSEKVRIKSVENFYIWLQDILENIPKK